MTKQQRIIRALIRWIVMPAMIAVGVVFIIKGYGIEALLVYVILALFMIWMELKELRLELLKPKGLRQ